MAAAAIKAFVFVVLFPMSLVFWIGYDLGKRDERRRRNYGMRRR